MDSGRGELFVAKNGVPILILVVWCWFDFDNYISYTLFNFFH